MMAVGDVEFPAARSEPSSLYRIGPSVNSSLDAPSPLFPAGTVTFLAAEIEDVASLLEAAPMAMASAVERQYELLHDAIHAHGGVPTESLREDDGIVAGFNRASDAMRAAIAAQRALQTASWPTPSPLRVRMAIHTGEATRRDDASFAGAAFVRATALRALASGGQVLVSSASRDVGIDDLDDETTVRDLGEHRLKDLARPERVYQLAHPEIESEFPRLRSLNVTPNNLPVRLSSFVGRAAEISVLDRLLADHRLITITGSGGAGKTRLALQTAANAAVRFPAGVWWVELAPLTDANTIGLDVGEVVGARLMDSADHARTIAARLGDDEVLLVLDNCEHLLDGCADLVDALLQRCPKLVVLATSRRPLDVPGEVTWRVPSLGLPEIGTVVTALDLDRFDGVRLFVDRAREVRPTFAMNDAIAPVVAEICHRLNGIPLAIELAAARTKTMLPAQILSGLDDALRLLTGGSRRVAPRQQTIDASVRWSCDLLDETAQVLLRRLSVFSGSFDLAGAEAVCSDDTVDAISVLDAIERLVDASLVMPLSDGQEGRFVVLETVRQYGARELSAAHETERWLARHATHFEHVVLDVAPQCETERQFAAVALIALDYDNIRASLSVLEQQAGSGASEHDSTSAARLGLLVLALGAFWDVSGERVDAAMWCTRALALTPEVPSVLRTRLLALRAESRLQISEFRGGFADATQAIAMGTEVGDAWGAGRGSAALTTILGQIDLDAWRLRWAETERLHREADDRFSLGRLMTWHAVPLLRRGMTREGAELISHAEPIVRATRQPMLMASQQVWESYALLLTGQLGRAEDRARTAIASGALGGRARIALAELAIGLSRSFRFLDRASAEANLARAELARRESDPLASDIFLYLAALELLHEDPYACIGVLDTWLADHPNRPPASRCTEVLVSAHASFALGDVDDAESRIIDVLRWATAGRNVVEQGRAKTLLAAVALSRLETPVAERHVRDAMSVLLEHDNVYDLCSALEVFADLSSICGDHGEAATLLGAMSAQRSRMSTPRGFFLDAVPATVQRTQAALGEAPFQEAFSVGLTLDLDAALALVDRAHGPRRRPSHGWHSLTPTELQVVDLVRQGLSNREIAVRLIMGAETVKTHLSNVFAKLGISKRTQLAAMSTERMVNDER